MKNSRRPVRLVVALCLLLALAACGQGGESGANEAPEKTDNASATGPESDAARATIPDIGIDDPSELKIAFFEAGSNNSYVQARIKAGRETAEELGASIEIFDASWDPTEQHNQIQNALTSGRFNAFVVAGLDGRQICDIVQQSVEQGILVATINEPICGRAEESGEEVWEPGTVTFVGGQTSDIYRDWISTIAEREPEGGKVAVFTGPELGANAVNFDAQVEQGLGDEFEVVATQRTDYSTPQGFATAQDTLQANPDLDIIISNYSGVTQGVVEAVQQANRDGIRIYDFGGNEWAINAVEQGQLEMTTVMLPYQEMQRAVEALAAHVRGEDVPRFINLTKDESLPGTPFVTPDNVDEFEAGY